MVPPAPSISTAPKCEQGNCGRFTILQTAFDRVLLCGMQNREAFPISDFLNPARLISHLIAVLC